jgi:hypothetical protein
MKPQTISLFACTCRSEYSSTGKSYHGCAVTHIFRLFPQRLLKLDTLAVSVRYGGRCCSNYPQWLRRFSVRSYYTCAKVPHLKTELNDEAYKLLNEDAPLFARGRQSDQIYPHHLMLAICERHSKQVDNCLVYMGLSRRQLFDEIVYALPMNDSTSDT